jgi:hypothetical protein
MVYPRFAADSFWSFAQSCKKLRGIVILNALAGAA